MLAPSEAFSASISSSSGSRLFIEKPSVILMDIEGTLTDIRFVSKKLFPFIKANVGTYFEETFDKPETQEIIKRLRESSRNVSKEEVSGRKYPNLRFLFHF